MAQDPLQLDLESYPGAMCRIDLEDGRVHERNATACTLLGAVRSLRALLGDAHYSALVERALSSVFWADAEVATEIGRLRLRIKALENDRAVVVMEPVAPCPDREDLDTLLDMVSDLRWEWDLRSNRAYHYGRGMLKSGIGAGGMPTTPGTLIDLVHPDDRDGIERRTREWLAGRAHDYCEEFRIRREDAPEGPGWRWIQSRGRIVERDFEGRPVRAVGLMTDVSARHEKEAQQALLESQLRHVQKLDALGQLTGGIAHDFNNILASVLGYSELGVMALQRSSVAESDDARKISSYLSEIRAASDRGRELIAKMLLFSRGGVQGDVAERAAPLSLVEDTVRMLRPMLPATLAVRLNVASDLSPVAIDPTQLQQLLLNLVINARDAVGENGVLTVTARRALARSGVCASCAQPLDDVGGMIEIVVADDGPGIPASVRERIFDPFFTTKETGRGSGLGLSVVHGIVHDHGGHVGLESSREGTAISLLLPGAEVVEAPPPKESVHLRADGRGRKVLVIDDETPIARWLGAMLEESGFVVDVYDDAPQALRRFELTPDYWDLVITDQAMPGLSGVELADELLGHDPSLPIIICSGFSEFVEEANAADFGFRAFLRKPVAGGELLATVVRVLEEGREARRPMLDAVG